jgi:hypothetical protein
MHSRMRAALLGVDDGARFAEGHMRDANISPPPRWHPRGCNGIGGSAGTSEGLAAETVARTATQSAKHRELAADRRSADPLMPQIKGTGNAYSRSQKHPHRSAPARTERGGVRRGARQRHPAPRGERLAWLDPAPLATVPASRPSRPITPPALVRAHRHGSSSGTSPASSPSRRGQWYAESGLTKGLAAGRFLPPVTGRPGQWPWLRPWAISSRRSWRPR